MNRAPSSARADVARQVTPRGIVVENVLLRDMLLPDTLRQAIEAKQQAEQEAQRMKFVLLREKQEAERKRIEAQGISDFQRIVARASASSCSSGRASKRRWR